MTLSVEAPHGMSRYHPVMIGGHRYCGDGDIMFLMVEEQDYVECARLNLPLLFIRLSHGLKPHSILC